MTVAVCLQCGGRKIGALVRCRSCGYEPKEEEEQAKSVLLSGHYLSNEDLSTISERIKSGQGVTFAEPSVQNLVESIRVVEKEGVLGGHKATLITCGVVIVLGVFLGLGLMAVSYLVGR